MTDIGFTQIARQEGQKAYYYGDNILENPYKVGKFADAWEEGFAMAEQDDRLEQEGI